MKKIILIALIAGLLSSCERNDKCGDPNALNYATDGVATDSCHCKYELYKQYESTIKVVNAPTDSTLNIDTTITQVITYNIDSSTGDTISSDTTITSVDIDTTYTKVELPIALMSFKSQKQYTTSGTCNPSDKTENENYKVSGKIKNTADGILKINFEITYEDNTIYENYLVLTRDTEVDIGIIQTATEMIYAGKFIIKVKSFVID